MVDDARPDDYYSVSGIRTGFGSVWSTISNNMSYADGALVRLRRWAVCGLLAGVIAPVIVRLPS